MLSHIPMSCQVLYPLDARGYTAPQLIVPAHAAIDLVNSPVSEWTIYLHPSKAQDVGRQVARWLAARTNGAGFVEAMAHAITDKRERGYAAIDLEDIPVVESHLKNRLAVPLPSYHEQWRQ